MVARALFGAANRLPVITTALRRMEVIHTGRWAIVRQLPGAAAPLPRPMLLSLFDYDGDLLSYIDVFADTVLWRFRAVWFSSYGYPGLIPTDGFDRWVRNVETTVGHYYAANATATTTMVGQALRLDDAFQQFREANGPDVDDTTFRSNFETFCTEAQRWL
jgi:hypothetical protein